MWVDDCLSVADYDCESDQRETDGKPHLLQGRIRCCRRFVRLVTNFLKYLTGILPEFAPYR